MRQLRITQGGGDLLPARRSRTRLDVGRLRKPDSTLFGVDSRHSSLQSMWSSRTHRHPTMSVKRSVTSADQARLNSCVSPAAIVWGRSTTISSTGVAPDG